MLKVTCILLRTLSRPCFVIFLKPHISSNFGYKTTLICVFVVLKIYLSCAHEGLHFSRVVVKGAQNPFNNWKTVCY